MLGALKINALGGTLLLLAAVGLFPFLSQIELKLSLSDLLPAENPLVRDLEEMAEMAGGVGYLVGIINTEQKEEGLKIAHEFKKRIERNNQVRYAFYEREESFFFDKLLYLQGPQKTQEISDKISGLKKQKIKSAFDLGLDEDEEKNPPPNTSEDYFQKLKKELSPQLLEKSRYFLSNDRKTLMVMIKPDFSSNELDKSEKLIHAAQDIFKKIQGKKDLPAFNFRFAGKYYDVWADTTNIQKNLGLVSFIGYIATLLFVLLFYTNLRLILALALPLACGIMLTFEIVGLTLGHVNIITGFLVATLSGIGIDYGIFLVSSYARQRELHPHRPFSKILYCLYRYDGRAVFSCLVASTFAFCLLLLGSFKGFYEFGFVCSVGLVTIFSCYTFMLPTILRFLPISSSFFKLINTSRIPQFRKGYLYPLVGVLFLIIFLGISKLSFEYDFEKIAGLSKETQNLHAEMDQIFGKNLTPAIIWAPDKSTEDKARLFLKAHSEAITQVLGLSDVLPTDQRETQKHIRQLKRTVDKISNQTLEENIGIKADKIRTLLTAKPYTFEDLPISLQSALKVEQGRLLYAYTDVPLSQIEGIRQISGILNQMKAEIPGIKVGLEALIFNEIINQVWKDGKLILSLLFVGLFLSQLFDQRSISRALWVMAPVCLGFMVTLGLMGFFNVRFNVINVSVIPPIFGTGIDVTIMFFHYHWNSKVYRPMEA
ncbi:MAG: MMPL family transporter, partial [Pseudomonadota bacterium]